MQVVKQATAGDRVSLWAPHDASFNVFVFHNGSQGGQGCLGLVPLTYARPIVRHLMSGLAVYAEVEKITDNGCTIQCRLGRERL
jgi:hypothetical protein